MTEAHARLRLYLNHIVQAIDRIDDYMARRVGLTLNENEMLVDAVVRNLEVIGEASNNILKRFPDWADNHPEIQLKRAYQMRNALSHGYFSIDIAAVWQTVERDLPIMRTHSIAALRGLQDTPSP